MTSGILLRLITDDRQSVNNEIPRGWYKLAQVREIGTARWYKYRYMYPKLYVILIMEDLCQNLQLLSKSPCGGVS